MIRGGVGGGNTKTGLIYEANVDLATFLNNQSGYVVKGMDIFFNEVLVYYLHLKYPKISYIIYRNRL